MSLVEALCTTTTAHLVDDSDYFERFLISHPLQHFLLVVQVFGVLDEVTVAVETQRREFSNP
jgi:hypothetical protein